MKVETKKTYIFEEGDVVADMFDNVVAIRCEDGRWESTQNSVWWTDKVVASRLDAESWIYMGNRVVMAW